MMERFIVALAALGLALAVAACGPKPGGDVVAVSARAETPPVGTLDDAADDPAVWVNALDPAASLVLGTDKKAGLHLYDLAGAEKEFVALGKVNNVDVRQGVSLDGAVRDIGATSLRASEAVIVFELDRGTGAFLGHGRIAVGQTDPYGICLGMADARLFVFVTYKDGLVEAHEILRALPVPASRKAGEVRLGGQSEGCVFDDAAGRLFVGEEDAGIHAVTFNADAGFGEPGWAARVSAEGPLSPDVEGLALYADAEGSLLVASSQERNLYVLYDAAPPHARRGAVAIVADAAAGIDGVTHTDGIEVMSVPLGPDFPCGLLVAQDDDNDGAPQNFKFVSWCPVAQALEAGAR